MLKRYPFKKAVAGCDEAGRGCLAGPVVAAAVILPKSFENKILNDSKLLSKHKRNLLRNIIENQAISWSIGVASPKEIDKKTIEKLLPHREPMLLIDKLVNIIHLKSATAIMYVKKNGFYVQGHFPGQPVMPGVLIVEAFGQAAAALTAHGIDKKEYENKLVFLMSVEKARFRNPVIPDCKLELQIEAIRSHGRVWKYKGEAFVEGKKMADAQWSATIVDRK